MCDCKTLEVSGPEAYLYKVYGAEIEQIHAGIERAIANNELESDMQCEKYVETNVYIPDHLLRMFRRMYVDEGGWRYLTTNYETARLYPPILD